MKMTCVPDSPLHEAAKNNNAEEIRALAAKGEDVNRSVKCEGIPQPVNISQGRPSAEWWDSARWTPLHVAANYGGCEAILALINLGANVSPPDRNGRTPLDWAKARGRDEAADLLEKHGGKGGRR